MNLGSGTPPPPKKKRGGGEGKKKKEKKKEKKNRENHASKQIAAFEYFISISIVCYIMST